MDVMYVSSVNFFYMDASAVSFLRALLWQAGRSMAICGLGLLLITSKTQHYPLGIPIGSRVFRNTPGAGRCAGAI
jgi:hypothetical protein